MDRRSRITFRFAVCVVLCMAFALGLGTARNEIAAVFAQEAEGRASPPTKQPSSLPEINRETGNNESIAGTNDAQARKALSQEGSKQARPETGGQALSGPGGISVYIDRLEDNIGFFLRRIVEVHSEANATLLVLSERVRAFSTKEGLVGVMKILGAALAILLAGIGSDRLYRRYADGVCKRTISAGKANGCSTVILRGKSLMVDLIALPVFAIASLVVYFALFDRSETARWIFITYLAIVLMVRGVSLCSRFFLSPDDASLRLVKLSTESAVIIHHWITRITAVGVSGLLLGELLELLDINREFDEIVQGLAGTVVLLMVIYLIAAYRQPVTAVIFKGHSGEAREGTPAPSLAAGFWHLLAIIYLVLVWFFWFFYILVGRADVIVPVLVTLGSIPLYWICDRLAQKFFFSLAEALQKADGSRLPNEEAARPEGEEGAGQAAEGLPREETVRSRIMPFLSRALSTSIALVILCWLLQLWGFFPDLGVAAMLAALKILVAISLAFVIWRWIELAIEKRVGKVQTVLEDDEGYGEGGEGSGSRVATILQISRKFILILLLSVVGLIILSAVGIDIKPLLAGAGVLGLAFGLGTQSLIKDIVSGMFFLVDDAFRIGDYVETGKIKGTVEGISIRSLRLRHPRGMIHTVPFSQLGSVTNFSRDYLISKIEFRVPYGTDVDKVKKVVKKLNEKVERDEELGPGLMSPIKSIGVTGFDDSGLLMAVKFRSKPSRQSELQRYVLKSLQESFGKHGLEFAHRHVVVRLPEGTHSEKHETTGAAPDGSISPPTRELLSASAAAAIAVALAEDETKEK